MASILDPILNPLLGLGIYSIIVLALIVSIISTVAYKYLTNQDLMKRLKSEMKELQAEMKLLKKEPAKMMEVQKRSMETNMKYMTQSFKPTLITFIPIILIFTWMSANLAFLPITPGEEFDVTVNVEELIGQNMTLTTSEELELISDATQKINSENIVWKIKANNSGEYSLTFTTNDVNYEKKVIISNDFGNYAIAKKEINDAPVKSISIGNKEVKLIEKIPILNMVPWIKGFGWLGSYILFSIFFSITIRKALKVA